MVETWTLLLCGEGKVGDTRRVRTNNTNVQ